MKSKANLKTALRLPMRITPEDFQSRSRKALRSEESSASNQCFNAHTRYSPERRVNQARAQNASSGHRLQSKDSQVRCGKTAALALDVDI